MHLLHEENVSLFAHLDTLILMKYAPSLLIALMLVVPFSTHAASKKPSCDLSVMTTRGETSFSKSGTIFALEGEDVTLSWESSNATKAKNIDGDSLSLSGSKHVFPKENTTYSYTFTSGSKKVVCKVDVVIANVAIDTSSLSNASTKPTITGTASGTKVVRVVISDKNGDDTIFTSKDVKVKGGKWSLKLTKSLDTGTYSIAVYGEKRYKLNMLAKGTLGVGVKGSSGTVSGTSTISASMLPLLTGGSTGPTSSVPVAYLKLVNTGSAPATLSGVSLRQNGSAPTASVVGFTTVDDKALNRTTVGGTEGSAVFKNGLAYVPLTGTIAPGQIRIYTVKALLSRTLVAGSTLMLDVQSVDTSSTVNGALPIRGVTWYLRAY
ncbi:MAG: hypothetical protein AB203_01095 [Parcubacteria bacterium C7867-008]|nr:MAG: hypothetical protein AB203_01095 [Parcubacteria bacterium C7867-008]